MTVGAVGLETRGSEISAGAQGSPSLVEVFEEGERLLGVAGFRGTIVVRLSDGTMLVSNQALSLERYWPCSTFKIPNSLIGLETGVVPDERFTLVWDGTPGYLESWNRDTGN